MAESLDLLRERAPVADSVKAHEDAAPGTPPRAEVYLFDGWSLQPLELARRD